MPGRGAGVRRLRSCPAANRLGEEGDGYRIALSALAEGRISIAAACVGIARSALEQAARVPRRAAGVRRAARRAAGPAVHARGDGTRRRGGTGADPRRRRRRRTAASRSPRRRRSRSGPPPTPRCGSRPTPSSCSAASGYSRETGIERLMRDAKGAQIYEGTNQIHRLIVADEVLKRARERLGSRAGPRAAAAPSRADRAPVSPAPTRLHPSRRAPTISRAIRSPIRGPRGARRTPPAPLPRRVGRARRTRRGVVDAPRSPGGLSGRKLSASTVAGRIAKPAPRSRRPSAGNFAAQDSSRCSASVRRVGPAVGDDHPDADRSTDPSRAVARSSRREAARTVERRHQVVDVDDARVLSSMTRRPRRLRMPRDDVDRRRARPQIENETSGSADPAREVAGQPSGHDLVHRGVAAH